MKNVLFVCHGNICRSVMAEFIFKQMVKDKGIENEFYIESCATSREEIGNDIYPLAKAKLKAMGIPVTRHFSRQINKQDIEKFDYILAMESYNLKNMKRVVGESDKMKRLLDYTNRPRDIADPWYTGNFDSTYDDIVEGLEAFLKAIK